MKRLIREELWFVPGETECTSYFGKDTLFFQNDYCQILNMGKKLLK